MDIYPDKTEARTLCVLTCDSYCEGDIVLQRGQPPLAVA